MHSQFPLQQQTIYAGVISNDDRERHKLEAKYAPLMKEELNLCNKVSFVGNKGVPFLRLYRYKEAFSFHLVRDFIGRFDLTPKDYIFDPFAGMGTTLFASLLQNIPSIGIDKLPIAAFIAQTIPKFFFVHKGSLLSAFEKLSLEVDHVQPAEVAQDVPIMALAFNSENFHRLRLWKSAITKLEQPYKDIFLLLFFSILEATSYTSKDGQFLRLKRLKSVAHPDEALRQKVLEAEQDLERAKWLFPGWESNDTPLPQVYCADTRNLQETPFTQPPTAIITSPPYVNRYDYTRSYSLELCFHFVKNFSELRAVRHNILRSHIESRLFPGETPTQPAIKEIVEALKLKALNNPRIPFMLIAYFNDMKKAIEEWNRVLAKGAKVALVVDNVRFEGELVPVDLILSQMAEEIGFYVDKVIIARYKGNSSQQMGKYGRVPVRESIVIWRKQ